MPPVTFLSPLIGVPSTIHAGYHAVWIWTTCAVPFPITACRLRRTTSVPSRMPSAAATSASAVRGLAARLADPRVPAAPPPLRALQDAERGGHVSVSRAVLGLDHPHLAIDALPRASDLPRPELRSRIKRRDVAAVLHPDGPLVK